MENPYIEHRPEGFYLRGSRVPLDGLIREYWQGEPPESIRQHFPTLTLEQVFGALAFYLANKENVEAGMRDRERTEAAYATSHPIPERLLDKLKNARQPAGS
jgi:uncharacterized protein (DUF433 family)